MEKEVFAVVFAIKHFPFYLQGKQFHVITDNKMDLQEFDFDIRHRPGSYNQNALSRLNH